MIIRFAIGNAIEICCLFWIWY